MIQRGSRFFGAACAGWALALFASISTAVAHEYYAANFKIIHPWALPTPPDVRQADVYLKFEEISGDDRLISASSPFAGDAIILDASGSEILSVEIKSNVELELKPGGVHLQLRDLKVPLQYERSYPMALIFEKSGRIDTEISVGAH